MNTIFHFTLTPWEIVALVIFGIICLMGFYYEVRSREDERKQKEQRQFRETRSKLK